MNERKRRIKKYSLDGLEINEIFFHDILFPSLFHFHSLIASFLLLFFAVRHTEKDISLWHSQHLRNYKTL